MPHTLFSEIRLMLFIHGGHKKHMVISTRPSVRKDGIGAGRLVKRKNQPSDNRGMSH